MWAAVALAFGLAMDATAVAAARGLAGHRGRELVVLPLTFGLFQSGMAAAGWMAGRWGGPLIARWNGWVGFGLLTLLGGKMILDGLRGEAGEAGEAGGAREAGGDGGTGEAGPRAHPPVALAVYVGLGVATSIDAAAAGMTLPLLPVPPWLSLALIGGITAACAAAGFAAGRSLGRHLDGKLEVAGGAILIAIGVKLLLAS